MICPHGHDEGLVERLATPEEVDAGCELGVAFDPCPICVNDVAVMVEAEVAVREVLLGVVDFDPPLSWDPGDPGWVPTPPR